MKAPTGVNVGNFTEVAMVQAPSQPRKGRRISLRNSGNQWSGSGDRVKEVRLRFFLMGGRIMRKFVVAGLVLFVICVGSFVTAFAHSHRFVDEDLHNLCAENKRCDPLLICGQEVLQLEATGSCAYIGYGRSCGFATSGTETYVRNRLNNRTVRATIRVYWSSGINDGSYQKTETISAGGSVFLGCSKSGSIPVTSYSYSVIGCEIL